MTRLAVVQMLPANDDPAEDLSRLASLVAQAREQGAEAIVLPAVPSLDAAGDALDAIPQMQAAGAVLLAPPSDDASGPPRVRETVLGRLVDLAGDQAIDPDLHAGLLTAAPNALVLRAEAESPLQAEAVLELAVGASTSLAGLVVVAATAALDPAGDVFGSSAIVVHGEILAEAIASDEVLVADVDAPVRLQEPASPPPEPQMILRQRLAHHRGGKAPVDWLADLD